MFPAIRIIRSRDFSRHHTFSTVFPTCIFNCTFVAVASISHHVSPTMGVQNGRSIALLAHLKAQSYSSHRTFSHISRVPALYNVLSSLGNTRNAFNILIATSTQHRTYADRPVSRPKAHTGRLPASKKSPTTSTTKAAKTPAKKKTTPKKIPSATAGTATKKKAAKPRIKAKPKKAKAKRKARAKPKKKPLTKEQKAEAKTKKAAKAKKTKVSDLKKKALVLPSRAEESAWNVFHTEQAKGKKVGQEGFLDLNKNISAAWKSIEPEQLEVRTRDTRLLLLECNLLGGG